MIAILFLHEVPLRRTIDVEETAPAALHETETGATGADTVRLRRGAVLGGLWQPE